MPSADFTGVVVAAGSSARFGGPRPKQFEDLAGKTVLERSVRALAGRPGVAGVVVVLAPDEVKGPRGDEIRRWNGVRDVVGGGASRAESVGRGLAAVGAEPYVMVHDAARPLAGADLVDAVMEATRTHGAAVPLLPVVDTVKVVDAGRRVVRTLDRDGLGLAQTPQGARVDWLREALARAAAEGATVTDEASALEIAGHPVAGVPGDPANRKITTPDDLEDARRLLGDDDPGLRVGSGFDVHRVDPARPLVLGGIRFEGAPGLAGHSDADVVLHAAMDAVLGAAGLGDIGVHFPPEDDRWKDADSADLAARVAGAIAERGYVVVNLDITLLAEAPKIRPRVDEMKRSIGRALSIEPSRIGLKATTLETLGALGRREGMACEAVALLRRARSGA